MFKPLRSLTSSFRLHLRRIQRRNTNEQNEQENQPISEQRIEQRNEQENEQRKRRTYSQSYPVDYKYLLDAEKWQIYYSLEKEFKIHIIMAFDAQSALIKSMDDMVYGVGVNLNGRLGLSNKDHNYMKPEKVDALCRKNIISFHCSSDETCFYALTEEGQVYCWGTNKRCRLGKGLENRHKTYTPFEMDLMDKFGAELCITQIACNNYNCLALTDSGEVYIWGSIDFTNNILQNYPCEVKALKKEEIVQIACGTSFVMALTNDDKLYIWGRNKNGQLGINTESEICKDPCLITSLENVQIDKIVCGSEHSLALTSEGKIYSWGNNCKGQLGHGERIKLERKPTMLKETTMGFISDIVAQHNTSAAIDELGNIYVWGFRDEYENDTIWEPIRIAYSHMYNVFIYKIPYIICTKFDDQSTSDFTIEVEGKCIYVHKYVLLRYEYFENMFQDDLEAARNNTIKCDDFPYNVYKIFFKFLYTNAIKNLPLELTFELLKLCEKCTKEDVNMSNVFLCYALAKQHNAQDLEDYCAQFYLDHRSNEEWNAQLRKYYMTMLSKKLLYEFLLKVENKKRPLQSQITAEK